MLSSPPLLLFLVLALVSGASTFTLLLIPILPSLPPHLNPFHRTLPRIAFSNLSPRTSLPHSSVSRSIAIFLASVELVVLCLGCWQELLLWAGKGSVDDAVGQGIRMGLAMVLRPVSWMAVSLYVFLRRETDTSSSSNASIRTERRKSLQLAGILSGLVLILTAVLAGASSASLQAAYGVVLVSSLLLMLLGTVLSGWRATRMLISGSVRESRSRPWRKRVGRDEKARFVQGEWRDEKEADRPPSREDLLKREVSRSRSRGPGWGEGESWLSSPDLTGVSLPPFDLSMPSTTQRSATPFDSGRPVTPHDFSRPITPYDTSLDAPPIDPQESSWITEPSKSGSTMSSFSFPSSLDSLSPKSDRFVRPAISELVRIDVQPTSPSSNSIYYNHDPHAPAMPTPLTPGFRSSAYSATTGRSSSALNLPLSPPPNIPLPPTPTPSRAPPTSYTYNAKRSSLDHRPSTTQERSSNDWAGSTQANTSGYRPSTEMYGTTAYYSSRLGSHDLVRASADEPGAGRLRQEPNARTEDWARLGLGKEELNSLDELEERERKRAWLGIACVVCAWIVFSLSIPSIIDCVLHASYIASSTTTLCLILSLTISSPVTLVLYLISRLPSLTSSSSSSIASPNQNRAPNRQLNDVYSALSFCDGPVRPSSEALMLYRNGKDRSDQPGLGSGRKLSGLRPLSLVVAKDRMERAEMVGRCLSPNEEGNMGSQWIDKGYAKAAGASRFSRAVSFLQPNPPLQVQALPFSVDLPAPPPRAASPSSSFTSSTHSSSINSSQLSAILDQVIENEQEEEACEGDETFRDFRERVISGVSQVEEAQILTAQRARGSVGRLVDLVESPRQVEFAQTVGEFGEASVAQGQPTEKGWSIDWLSAGLLTGLVPSIRIGSGISIGPHPSTSNHRTSPEPTSILRQASAYDAFASTKPLHLSRPRPRPHSTSFALTSFSSNQSSIPYDPADRVSGAKAPTPGSSTVSHGRSSSIETASLSNVHKRSFSNLFNSTSFLSSTPHRQGDRLTQSTKDRPTPTSRAKHKAYHSLSMLNGVSLDAAWGDELRGELDQYGVVRSPVKKALPRYDADVEAARAANLSKGTFGEWKVANGTHEPLLIEEDEEEGEDEEDEEDENEGDMTITSYDFSSAQADAVWDQGLAEPTFIVQDQSLSREHRSLGSAFPVPEDRETVDNLLDEIMIKLQGRPQSQSYSVNDDDLMADYDDDEQEEEGSVTSQPTSSNIGEIPDSYNYADTEIREEPQRFSMASSNISFHRPLTLQRPTSQASFASATTDASSLLSSPSPSPIPSHRAGSAHGFSHHSSLKNDNASYPLGRPSSSLSGLLRPGSSASGAIRPESRHNSSRPDSRQASRPNSHLSIYSSPSEPPLPTTRPSVRPSSRASLRAESSRPSSRASSTKHRSILADRSSNVGPPTTAALSATKGSSKGGIVKRRSFLSKSNAKPQEPMLVPTSRYKGKGSNFGGLVKEDSQGHIRVFKPKPIR